MADKRIEQKDLIDPNIFVNIIKQAAELEVILKNNLKTFSEYIKANPFKVAQDVKDYKASVDAVNASSKALKDTQNEQVKATEDLNKELKKGVENQIQAKKVADEVNGTLKQNILLEQKRKSQLAVLTKEQKNLNDQLKKGRISLTTYDSATAKLSKQTKELKIANSELGFTIKAQIKDGQAAVGSFQQQAQTLGQLRTAYRRLNKEQRENANVGGILLTSITKLDKQTKANDASIGNFQRSVGNYTGGIKAAAAQTGLFAGVANASAVATGLFSSAQAIATTVIGTTTGALKLFRVALVSTGIGAIVVLFGSLVAALLSSEKGINMLKKGFAAIGIVIGNLTDVFAEFGEQLISFFKGDGFDSEGLKKKIAGIVSEIKTEVAAQLQLSDLRAKTDKDERKALVDKASREKEISKLRLDARDLENKSDEERVAALKEAIALENLILDDEVKIAKARAKVAVGELSFNKSKKEAKDKAAAAEAKVFEVETKSLLRQATLKSELNTLELKQKRKINKLNADAAKIAKETQKIINDAAKKAAEEAAQFDKDEIERSDRNFLERTRVLEGQLAYEQLLLTQSYEDKFKDAKDDAQLEFALRKELQAKLEKLEDDAASEEKKKRDKRRKDNNDAFAKDADAAIKKDEDAKKIADAKQDESVANANKIASAINDSLNQISNKRIAKIQEEEEKTVRAIDRQERRAEQGLENNLAFEQKKAAELEKQREDEAKKQEQRAKVLAYFNLFSEFAKAEPNTAAFKAAAQVAIAETVSGLFYEGTEKVEDDIQGKPMFSGRDGYVVRVDGSERIMTGAQNSKLGGISNDDLVELATNGNGQVGYAVGMDTRKLESKLDSVIKAVQSNDKSVHWDSLGNRFETQIKNEVKKVTKHKKRIS